MIDNSQGFLWLRKTSFSLANLFDLTAFFTIRQARLENWKLLKVSTEILIVQFSIEVSSDVIWQIYYLAYIICDEDSWKNVRSSLSVVTFCDSFLFLSFSLAQYNHLFVGWLSSSNQLYENSSAKHNNFFITVGQLAWFVHQSSLTRGIPAFV